MDQAQHFGALGAAAGGSSSSSGQTGEDFREGLDETERERMFLSSLSEFETDINAVFVLAQESAKRTKQWYESSDKTRR